LKKYWPKLYLILIVISLLSCNLLANVGSESKSLDGTPTPTLIIPSPTQTPMMQTSQPCPISAGSPVPFQPSSFDVLPDNILQYLNSDGKIATMYGILEAAGMVQSETPGWVEADFTGDALDDIAIVLIDPETEDLFPPGTLILARCSEDHYELGYEALVLNGWSAPEILSSEDLNGDQVPDLLIGRDSCGAHTCFTQLEALLWNGETLENRLQGTSDDMPSPTIDVDPVLKTITVTAEGIGSVGAGPFRRFLRQWTWNADQQLFLPSPDTFLPSNFRIHALHDADQAALNGDYENAVTLYNKVIWDDALQDYMDPSVERPQLAAYASFRLMLTYLLMDNTDQADAEHASIMTNYPASSTASDYVLLADTFWSEYQTSGEIGSACLAAQSFADSHRETILDTLYYGYANPTYEAIDICPFTD
jgi:hypothetical protein